MRDIVLIPTCYRPEYLWLCLEHIAKADGGTEKEIWVAHDKHMGDENRMLRTITELMVDLRETPKAIKEWEPHFPLGLHYTERFPHTYIGNPYNFLELYKAASEQQDVRYVYLIEDDVHVAPDFFRWHEEVQSRADYFCTVGWHCMRNEQVRKSGDPTEYIESAVDYSSIGVCWKHERLPVIVKHANKRYYGNPNGYLRTEPDFHNSPIPWQQWGEQAGLILRLLLAQKTRVTAWPSMPRCAHVGICGYHRNGGYRFAGNLQDRVTQLREVEQSTDKLLSLCKDNFDDVEHQPVIPTYNPADLHVVQRFI